MTTPKDKPKSELTEKTKDNLSLADIQILKSTGDILSRIGVYSLNIGSSFLSKAYKAEESIGIGNFYGALGFATLDVLAKKNSKFKRLAKSGGFLFYVGSCGYDLISGLNDWNNFWPHIGNFALDVSMAYQLGKDMRSSYKKSGEDSDKDKEFRISEDLESIVSFIKENLSTFGKSALTSVGYGLGAGYSFGKGAFENLKENYSFYRTKQKEKSEIKKLENEKNKKEKEEQKIKEQKEKEIKEALEKMEKPIK